MSDKEIERLKRLREQQVSARDPRQADYKRRQVISQRPRKFSLAKELDYLGPKITWTLWGGLIGLLLGLLFGTVLWLAFSITWGAYVIIGMVLFCGLLGRFFGGIKETGREDWRK